MLDSTICNANTLCRIPEQVSLLHTALDVRRTFLPGDAFGQWMGVALDFKAARKRIKVRPSEHDALLFEWKGTLRYFSVCHFGAKVSAYWWQRLGALLARITHKLLGDAPRKAWLYVDDLLVLLHTVQAQRASRARHRMACGY